MVTVATSLDAPIKILFPKSKYLFLKNAHGFALLGGGDIIVPGLWCGLCLRYDWCVPPSFVVLFFFLILRACTSQGLARRSHRRTQSGQKDNGNDQYSTNRSSRPRLLRTSSGSGQRSVRCSGSKLPSRRCCTSGTSGSLALSLSLVRTYVRT